MLTVYFLLVLFSSCLDIILIKKTAAFDGISYHSVMIMSSMLLGQHTHHHNVHHTKLLSPHVHFIFAGTFHCFTIFASGAHFELTFTEHEMHHVLEGHVVVGGVVAVTPILPLL
jgi:hypothetical protein